MMVPAHVKSYARTAEFTEQTVPPGLLKAHTTKAGSWGLIHVLEGRLTYRITDPRHAPSEVVLTPEGGPAVIEPTVVHEVEPVGSVRFYVEFLREPGEASAAGRSSQSR